MFSIQKMATGSGGYYLDLAREDYYLKGGEPLGYWLGEGAAKLGLDGNVKEEQLRELFAGLSPDGKGVWMVQNRTDSQLAVPSKSYPFFS